MKSKELLAELEKAIELLGVELRYERNLWGSGGYCILKGKKMAILNKGSAVSEKTEILLGILKNQSVNDIFLPPAVRGLIDGDFPETDAS